ncbi:MAG TPA: DEAD/DEAH box helicase [Streptosporangiaceae bacterium]|nr:DEAD/DEAH box helicase [Streptosporangiaceae bacterium]
MAWSGRRGVAGVLVIHGMWARGALCLWAEDSALPASLDAPAGGRPSRAPRPHPFAADPGVLGDALGLLGEGPRDLASKAAADELSRWLPSAGPGPMCAPELIRDAGPEVPPRRRAALGCWRVPALAFGPAAALTLLAALDPVDSPPAAAAHPDLIAGGSAVYWAAVARFAADLCARGRVLPVLGRVDDSWAASWRPVLTGPDAPRAAELAGAMPPVCRAGEPGGEPPGPLLAAALDALADAAARARLDAGPPPAALLPPRRGRRPARVPVAERWASALTGPDAGVEVASAEDEAEVAELSVALDAWRAAAQAPAGPVRTCFRLVEPVRQDPVQPDPGPPESVSGPTGPAQPSDDEWRVEFTLQSAEDPSLMLAADDVWAGTGGWAPGGIARPDEELLLGLGSAARLFGELEDALRDPAPAGVALDTAGAFRFLKETGPLLAGAGFGVLLPDWARKARLGLKLTSRSQGAAPSASASVPNGSGFGLNDLVEFRYDLAVGDTTLDADELAELAQLKIPLVRVRGQWVELDEGNLQAALKFMARGREGVMRAGDVLVAGLRGPEEDLEVTAVAADGWLGDLLSGAGDRSLTPVTAPSSFRGDLRPYQERGLAWLSFLSDLGLGGILADDMGLGKSVQTLALLDHERVASRGAAVAPGAAEAGSGAAKAGSAEPGEPQYTGPTLLVCPMSLVGNWQREAERFTPDLAVHVHHGSDRLSGPDLHAALTGVDLVITTYALAARDREALAAVPWRRVVCDEAQNIKNAGTRHARAVRGLPARSRLALTGTPVENHLGELWSIMEFTSPGLLGPAEKFREHFAVPVQRHGDEEAAARLKRLTGPFILRRVKTDRTIISDLPDKIEMKIWCTLTPEQASLYQATVTDMLARIDAAEADIERRGLVLATMAKLKQVCNHPAHLLGDGSRLPGRSGKLARLEEICEEIVAAGDKALCFTQYAEFGRVLQPYLAARLGCPVLYLHGGTGKNARDALVAEFQNAAEPAVFLLSLKAGGTGLNLTAASHVIHFDRWWNPAVEDQATDRAFRIGQRKDVQVRKFVCVGTLEERIDAMIEEKKALADRIVGTGEAWLTELSTADLGEVLALSPEAVAE